MSIAGHRVKHAVRHARFFRQRQQRKSAQRRVVCRLDNAGAACRQGGSELARQHRHRKVPRRDRGNDANRLARGKNTRAGFGRRNDFAVSALRLLGEPLNKAGGVFHLAFRLFQRLALFGSHQLRQPGFVVDHQLIPAIEDLGTRFGGLRAPGGESAFGGGDSLFGLGLARFRHGGQHFAGGRVQHIKGSRGAMPFAIGQIAGLKKFAVVQWGRHRVAPVSFSSCQKSIDGKSEGFREGVALERPLRRAAARFRFG